MHNSKEFYKYYSENITGKRYHSPYPLRRYVHRTRVECLLGHLIKGETILEVGTGDGFFAIAAAKSGFNVTGVDYAKAHLAAARTRAAERGVANRTTFLHADAENLPFHDNAFDVVVASHVLEHLEDFEKGVREVFRVARKRAIIALPTALNPCAFVILGGSSFWYLSLSSLLALPAGFARVLSGFLLGKQGIDQGGYASEKTLPHIWFFPGRAKRILKAAGFRKITYEPDALCFPYFPSLIPLMRFLEKRKSSFLLRSLGYGTHFICEK